MDHQEVAADQFDRDHFDGHTALVRTQKHDEVLGFRIGLDRVERTCASPDDVAGPLRTDPVLRGRAMEAQRDSTA
jgi:hypothetical protein